MSGRHVTHAVRHTDRKAQKQTSRQTDKHSYFPASNIKKFARYSDEKESISAMIIRKIFKWQAVQKEETLRQAGRKTERQADRQRKTQRHT